MSEILVVDEAGQLIEPEFLIAIKPSIKLMVFAGDPKQLPPLVLSNSCKEKKYGRSVFKRLQKNNVNLFFLGTQYRMHQEICYWPNNKFYQGQLKSKVSEVNLPWFDEELYWGRLILLDFKGKEEVDELGSKFNTYEAKVVQLILKDLFSRHGNYINTHGINISVISPYEKQVQTLKRELKSLLLSNEKSLRISTVDGFQGGEAEVIIFSAVRSNEEKKVGFLGDKHRINVGLTRAKHSFLLIGDRKTLLNDSHWDDLIKYLEAGGNIRRADDYPHIKKIEQEALVRTNIIKKSDILSSSWSIFFFIKS